MGKLTKADVLSATLKAVAPFTAYIADVILRKWDDRNGSRPTVATVRRVLGTLEADGLLVRSRFPQGYYGYEWTITPEGRAALLEPSDGQ